MVADLVVERRDLAGSHRGEHAAGHDEQAAAGDGRLPHPTVGLDLQAGAVGGGEGEQVAVLVAVLEQVPLGVAEVLVDLQVGRGAEVQVALVAVVAGWSGRHVVGGLFTGLAQGETPLGHGQSKT